MFGYISFRAILAIILSLLISAIFGEYFIHLLKKKQITETQRDASIDPARLLRDAEFLASIKELDPSDTSGVTSNIQKIRSPF